MVSDTDQVAIVDVGMANPFEDASYAGAPSRIIFDIARSFHGTGRSNIKTFYMIPEIQLERDLPANKWRMSGGVKSRSADWSLVEWKVDLTFIMRYLSLVSCYLQSYR